MRTIDIVLPVYNEAGGISAFHQALASILEPLGTQYRFGVIYVLDRSRDGTFAVLKKLADRYDYVTILHLSRRFGHQMSLVAGIDYSQADAIIMMDCDQEHPPAIIPLLLEKFEEGYEIVHTIREYDSSVPFLKRWTSNLFYRMQNAVSPVELQPGAADFRLISSKVARVFQGSIREQNQFLRGLFQWIGFATTTVPFVSAPRPVGETKYRPGRLLAFAITGILSFSKIPLRLASLLGLAISSVSVLYGFSLILFYFLGGYVPQGYTSMIVIILFMGGLQLMVLGILGEYIGSIFDEVKGRPLYVIDEIVQGKAS